MATGPDLRIGDADREAAAAFLREHYAQGRLTLEEFNQRLDAAFAAATQGQLSQLTRDLPHVSTVPGRLPASSIRPARERARREYRGHGYAHGRSYRSRRSPLASVLALSATLLIMALVIMPDLRFPLPGKLGLLIAIFAVLRGLLRRILGGGRRRF